MPLKPIPDLQDYSTPGSRAFSGSSPDGDAFPRRSDGLAKLPSYFHHVTTIGSWDDDLYDLAKQAAQWGYDKISNKDEIADLNAQIEAKNKELADKAKADAAAYAASHKTDYTIDTSALHPYDAAAARALDAQRRKAGTLRDGGGGGGGSALTWAALAALFFL